MPHLKMVISSTPTAHEKKHPQMAKISTVFVVSIDGGAAASSPSLPRESSTTSDRGPRAAQRPLCWAFAFPLFCVILYGTFSVFKCD